MMLLLCQQIQLYLGDHLKVPQRLIVGLWTVPLVFPIYLALDLLKLIVDI